MQYTRGMILQHLAESMSSTGQVDFGAAWLKLLSPISDPKSALLRPNNNGTVQDTSGIREGSSTEAFRTCWGTPFPTMPFKPSLSGEEGLGSLNCIAGPLERMGMLGYSWNQSHTKNRESRHHQAPTVTPQFLGVLPFISGFCGSLRIFAPLVGGIFQSKDQAECKSQQARQCSMQQQVSMGQETCVIRPETGAYWYKCDVM